MSAKQHLKNIGNAYNDLAIAAHVKGHVQGRTSARIEMLGRIATEREADLILKKLLDEGCVRFSDGVYVIVEEIASAAVEHAADEALAKHMTLGVKKPGNA